MSLNMLPALTVPARAPPKRRVLPWLGPGETNINDQHRMLSIIRLRGPEEFRHASEELRRNPQFIQLVLQHYQDVWGDHSRRTSIQEELPIFMGLILPGGKVSTYSFREITTRGMFNQVPPPEWLDLTEDDPTSKLLNAHYLLRGVESLLSMDKGWVVAIDGLASAEGWTRLREGVSDILLQTIGNTRITNYNALVTLAQLLNPKWFLRGTDQIRSDLKYEFPYEQSMVVVVATTQPLAKYINLDSYNILDIFKWATNVCSCLHDTAEVPFFLKYVPVIQYAKYQHDMHLSRNNRRELVNATWELVLANPRALYILGPECKSDLANCFLVRELLSLDDRQALMDVIGDPDADIPHGPIIHAFSRDMEMRIMRKDWDDAYLFILQWHKAIERRFLGDDSFDARAYFSSHLLAACCTSQYTFDKAVAVIKELWDGDIKPTTIRYALQHLQVNVILWIPYDEELLFDVFDRQFGSQHQIRNIPGAIELRKRDEMDRILIAHKVILDRDLLLRYATRPHKLMSEAFIVYLLYRRHTPYPLEHDFWMHAPWTKLPQELTANIVFLRRMAHVNPNILRHLPSPISDFDLMRNALTTQHAAGHEGTFATSDNVQFADPDTLFKPEFYNMALLLRPTDTLRWLFAHRAGRDLPNLDAIIRTAVEQSGDAIAVVPLTHLTTELIELALLTARSAASFTVGRLGLGLLGPELKRKILRSNIDNIADLMIGTRFPEWTNYDMEFLFLAAMKEHFESARLLVDRILITTIRHKNEAHAAVDAARKHNSTPIHTLGAVVKYDLQKFAAWCVELRPHWPSSPPRPPHPGEQAFDDYAFELDRVNKLEVFSPYPPDESMKVSSDDQHYDTPDPPSPDNTVGDTLTYLLDILTSPKSLNIFYDNKDTSKTRRLGAMKRARIEALVQAAVVRVQLASQCRSEVTM